MAKLKPTWKILAQPEGPDLEKTQLVPTMQNIKAPLLDNDNNCFLIIKRRRKNSKNY